MQQDLPQPWILAAAGLVVILSIASEASAQVPFGCTGEAFITHRMVGQLVQIDQTVDPFVFTAIGAPSGIEVNNTGFRRSDGLLYAAAVAVASDVTNDLVQIDRTGSVFSLGIPAGLPVTIAYNSGDVSPDGATLYLSKAGTGTLYRVALPALTLTSTVITGASGNVADLAANPDDGLLYGGDNSDGQLVILDPVTGIRTDLAVGGDGLPAGISYGGAWFNAAGDLFLYRSDGLIYEVDLSGLTSVATTTGPNTIHNDGAACIQKAIGVAKHMTSTQAGFPDTVNIDFTVENFGDTDTLSNLSASDDLTAVFGIRGTGGTCAAPTPADADWFMVSISSVPAAFANSSFDGDPAGDTQLINQAPTQSLGSGSSATLNVVITLCNQENATPPVPPGTGGPPYLFFNSTLFTAENPVGLLFGDLTHDDGTVSPDPDPDLNGSPDERVPAQVPVELISLSID